MDLALHRSLQLMATASAEGQHEQDDGWLGMGLCDGTRQETGRGDTTERRGMGLPSVCWLSLAGERKEKQKEKATQR